MSDKELDLTSISKDIMSFLLKRWYWLLLFAIIGAGIGAYQYNNCEIIYESDTIIQSAVVPAPVLVNHVNELGSMLENGQYESFATRLNWAITEAENIQKLNLITIYDQDEQNYLLKINAAKDAGLVNSCLTQLGAFLEQNEYVKEELDIKEDLLSLQIAQNTSLIETLNTILDQMAEGNSSSIYADPASISKQIVELQSENLLLSRKLDKLSVFEVIDTMVIEKHPSLIKSVISSVIVVGFLGLVLLLIIEFVRLSRE